MAETAGPLPTIIELAKIDVALARIANQKKNLQADIAKRAETLKSLEAKHNAKKKLCEEKKIKYDREEKLIRGEREKLSDRRRALVSLSSYKLQQAGEREVEYAAKQLSAHEDAILNLLKEAEILEKEFTELHSSFEGLTQEFAAFEPEAKATLADYDKQTADLTAERAEAVKKVTNHQALTIYNRSRERYPFDPVVPVVRNEQCSGCHMKVGPQVLVSVSRGEIVRCPGCARVMNLEQQNSAAA